MPERLLLACRTGCCRTTLVVTSGSGSGAGSCFLPSRSSRLAAPSCPLAGPGELAAASREAEPVCTRSVAELALPEPDPVLARGEAPDVGRPLPVAACAVEAGRPLPVPARALPVAGRAAVVLVPDGLVPLAAGLVLPAGGLVLPARAEPAVVFAAPDAGLAELDPAFAGPDSERIALRVARARPPMAVLAAPAGFGSTVQLRNIMYCCPSVNTLVVTQ